MNIKKEHCSSPTNNQKPITNNFRPGEDYEKRQKGGDWIAGTVKNGRQFGPVP
jgi:hypothetical protein